MKKIPKKLLDDCIEASRNFWDCYTDTEAEMERKLSVRRKAADALEDAIGVDWMSIANFIDGIVNHHGFCPDAENDEIYCALRCIGWDVVNE